MEMAANAMKPDATTSTKLTQYAALQPKPDDESPITRFFLVINPTNTPGPRRTNTNKTIISIARWNKSGKNIGTKRAGRDSNK
jgi:hypothetical protein